MTCRLVTLTFLLVTLSHLHTASSDINSGCPFWGCLPWASFSLSAGVPVTHPQVKWTTSIGNFSTPASAAAAATWDFEPGCISNQDFVVCTTPKGYVSMDPMTGEVLWVLPNMTSPFIPLMDTTGDVIAMDTRGLYYINNDGTPMSPIDIATMSPRYGVMVSNNSILVVTGSNTSTAQLVTYDTSGIIDAALDMKGSWERINGTFVPCRWVNTEVCV